MTASIWTPAYVGLGSNLQQPVLQVQLATQNLARLPESQLILCSPLYRSAPMGPQDQPDFVNAVAGLLTRLTPLALLQALKEIEIAQGRIPLTQHWGPRVIDLDLLLYGALQCSTQELTLPHAGLHERAFVLQPLCDIAPDLEVPGRGRVRELLARVNAQNLCHLPIESAEG